jgi:hypothetical protein
MKTAIELLEEAQWRIASIICEDPRSADYASEAEEIVKQVIDCLKTPRWETPDQYKKRTGEPWPDRWAVYALYEDNDGNKEWFCGTHGKERSKVYKGKTK